MESNFEKQLINSHILFKTDLNLSSFCSFNIGGIARYAVFPNSIEQFCLIMQIIKQEGMRWIIIGNGTNLLIDDAYLDMVAIVTNDFHEIIFEDDLIQIDAGASISNLILQAKQKGIGDFVFLVGIPGSIGGACYTNAGAFDDMIWKHIHSVTYYDYDSEKINILYNHTDLFQYRTSIFKNQKSWIILNICLQYSQILPISTIEEKIESCLKVRKEKQPISVCTAGCVFKNPSNSFAGLLIEKANLKEYTNGGARISPKHANFIENFAHASFADVLSLIQIMHDTVWQKYKFDLKLEIEIIKG